MKQWGRTSCASLLLLALALPVAAAMPWPSRELRDRETGAVEGVAFSADGIFLASADNGGTVLVRMFPGPRSFAKLQGNSFTEVVWSADGEALVAGGMDGLVYVWRRPLGEMVRALPYDAPVQAVAVDPNGVIYAAGGGDWSIRRWLLPKLEQLPPLRGHTDDVYAVRVGPGGTIASGGKDRMIRIWDASGRQSRTIRGRDDSINDLAFSPDGTLLASAYGDGTVALWNTHTWRLDRLMPGPSRGVRDLAVSPDGRWLAGAGFDHQVWIWALGDTIPAQPLPGHRLEVNCVAFSPNSRWLASAGSDTTVRLWTVP